MAFGGCRLRRDPRRRSLASCHRAGGLCNQQNGLFARIARKFHKIKVLTHCLDVFVDWRGWQDGAALFSPADPVSLANPL